MAFLGGLGGLMGGGGGALSGSSLAAIAKWRELTRVHQRAHSASKEDSQRLVEQARERLGLDVLLARLRERRRRSRLDPRGALRRARERLLEARLSLRALKDEQKERLRAYVRKLPAAHGGGGTPAPAAAAATGLDDEASVAAALGADSLLRSLVLAGVGGACRLFLHGASRTRVEGGQHLAAALERPAGQALITVSNHVGSIDDPLITAALVPPKYLLRPRALRWTMCATDRCFKSAALTPFFRAAKVRGPWPAHPRRLAPPPQQPLPPFPGAASGAGRWHRPVWYAPGSRAPGGR